MRMSIIMPCYNEQPTLRRAAERVLAAPPHDAEKQLVIVDDGSTDGSADIARSLAKEHPEITALFHSNNAGKGAAIRTAQPETDGDIVLIQDADLEYDPASYPALIKPILDDHADVVYGSRFVGGGPHRALFYRHSLGNRFLTALSDFTTDLFLTDMETCYKVFRGDAFRSIVINSDGFGFEPEITAKVARLGLRVYEVPVEYYGRTYADGKKITWLDGVGAVFTILRYWLFPGPLARDDEERGED
ncbi:MAG: glycosyltransferase family 2 protein [Planctomycetes bacterium]|nr:glycosyltransferase family 2 protein [Planctomycetota bacterium]